jgi:AcrR family transcriptional regulator
MTPRARNSDRTRASLIGAASRLFASRGYDNTAVDTIVQEAGVSKGAFYHHFKTKDELLDAVAERMAGEAMMAIEPAIADRSIGALGRLNRFFAIARTWGAEHFGLLREVLLVLYRDENVRLRRKVEAHTFAWSAPVLADILRQGVEEHVFDLTDPDEAAQAVLRFAWAIREAQVISLRDHGVSPQTLAALDRRLALFVEMLERMIGAPKGAVERLSYPEVVSEAFREAAAVSTAERTGQQ